MQRNTKVLSSVLGLLVILNGFTLYFHHETKGELEVTQKNLSKSQEELGEVKLQVNKAVKELGNVNKELDTTKNQLKDERMKAETLQKSLTDLNTKVVELRKQNQTLQNQKKELERKQASSAPKTSAQATRNTSAKVTTVSRGGSPTSAKKTIYVVGTAYTNHDAGMNGKGITATGTNTVQGRTVAVDPSVIPLGSKLHITSASYPAINGYYVAEDTGGAIKGNKMDIFFNSPSQAKQFGVRHDLVVRILN